MTDQLKELKERCRYAMNALNKMGQEHTDPLESERLLGKANGVGLAISYIEDLERV